MSKLPIVLKPAMGGDDCPSFEVEEASDGRLTLLPVGPKAANAKSLVAKKKAPANQSATGLDFANFQNAVSAGYFSMLHVFKYLSTKDRLSASKGQLISECLFDVLNFPKKKTQKFDEFLP